MNITDIATTPLHIAFDEVVRAAEARGVRVTGTEIVGLVPKRTLIEAGKHFLRKQHRSVGVAEEEIIRMNKEYLRNIQRLLENLENTQEQVIEQVAEACAACIYNGGLLYFFGTGHSHMICEEPFYRAGGLASIYPILETDLMLHEGASKSSGYERLEGLGNLVVSNAGLGKGDVLFIASNSGRNCAVIDAAMEAKKRGAITVAITSMSHTTQVTSRHSSGLNLYQVCDYVLDNGGELGDASVELDSLGQKIAPTSSVMDITLVNLILVNTVELLLKKGIKPPVFMSANTDAGDEANRDILKTYKARIPKL